MESIKHKGFTEATVARHVLEVVRMSWRPHKPREVITAVVLDASQVD